MASRNLVCMAKGSDVKRVHRRNTDQMLAHGWAFCPRSKWKKEVRDQKGYTAPVHEAPTQKKKEKKPIQKI
jgi:hypothetical protein